MKISPIPCLKDNYVWAIETGTRIGVVDPTVAENVISWLGDRKIDYILNTHHHGDHVGGNLKLREKYGCEIIGFEGDSHRIPGITRTVRDGEKFTLDQTAFEVLFIPGHTLGHIAYYHSAIPTLFCGDTIFSLGCGRLFEGTPEQMYESLSRLCHLPDETMIYCAHEYTLQNSRFALTLEPNNSSLHHRIEAATRLREAGLPTLPVALGEEKLSNPFLRVESWEMRKKLGMESSAPVEVFAKIRKMKDEF